MSRRILTEEQVVLPPNYYMVEGSVYVEEDAVIPITDRMFNVIGAATKIERAGRFLVGDVDCEIPESFSCNFFLGQVEGHSFKGIEFITKARLLEVNVIPIGPAVLERTADGKET